MITAEKDLTVLDSTIELDVPGDAACAGTVQYVSGAGTIVVEGKVTATNVWVVIGLTPAAGGAMVQLMAAVGMAFFNTYGCDKIRVRKSVGAAALVAALGLGRLGQ